jgi:hypothetical protein
MPLPSEVAGQVFTRSGNGSEAQWGQFHKVDRAPAWRLHLGWRLVDVAQEVPDVAYDTLAQGVTRLR